VQSQTPNAPLVPALTSLVLLLKPGVLEGFGVLIGFLALLTMSAYGIGERLAGPRLGALAALAVGAGQGAFIFTREYIFALPTAALLMTAVYALLRSDRLRSKGWAIVAGVALGSMLLARTMAVAFVPGVLLGAVLLSFGNDRERIAERLLNLVLMVVAAVLTAALWYWRNLQPVVDYLTSYGYGTQSNYYGAEHAFLSWGRFRAVFDRMIYDDLLLPLTTLVVIGLAVLGYRALRSIAEATSRREALSRLVGADAFFVFFVFAAGYGALMSSQNGGNGFTYPLAVLLPPLAVTALRGTRAALPVACLVGVIAALNVAAHSNFSDEVSRIRAVQLPVLGGQPWIGAVPHAVGGVREQIPGPPTRFEERDKGWPPMDEKLAGVIIERLGSTGTVPIVVFGSRNRVISTNSVGLAALLNHHQGIPFVQLNAEPSDSVETYLDQLSAADYGTPPVLITMDRNTDDFPPLVTQSYAEAAAKRLGYRQIHSFGLPDGRQLRIWQERNIPHSAAASARASTSAEAKQRHSPGGLGDDRAVHLG
jgi:dolichyl-phosphate-mannose-protein mannosyltransferase